MVCCGALTTMHNIYNQSQRAAGVRARALCVNGIYTICNLRKSYAINGLLLYLQIAHGTALCRLPPDK